jgi:hypothetical protein
LTRKEEGRARHVGGAAKSRILTAPSMVILACEFWVVLDLVLSLVFL